MAFNDMTVLPSAHASDLSSRAWIGMEIAITTLACSSATGLTLFISTFAFVIGHRILSYERSSFLKNNQSPRLKAYEVLPQPRRTTGD